MTHRNINIKIIYHILNIIFLNDIKKRKSILNNDRSKIQIPDKRNKLLVLFVKFHIHCLAKFL